MDFEKVLGVNFLGINSEKTIHLVNNMNIPVYTNEYWTSKQRQGHSVHEISYRACFKSQLPAFFIKNLSEVDEVIYDPFSGRGTTIIEALLLGRNVIANDVNPLSKILSKGRMYLPELQEVIDRLYMIPYYDNLRSDIDLSMFYHEKTESEIVSLQKYLNKRAEDGTEDKVDKWIRMVATNRLTGHSKGFFSVYTLPPNQAVTQRRQIIINQKRNQIPDYRDTRKIIIKKSKTLLKSVINYDRDLFDKLSPNAKFFTEDARFTKQINANSVSLTITSPPFLKVVQYADDNWLRCWFNGIDVEEISKKITMASTVEKWNEVMQDVFIELYRITKQGGWVAFEVGEVQKGKIKLEEQVVNLGINAGFECKAIMVNKQDFTKTANIWGVSNNSKGTNTNRIVIFHK